MLAQEEAEWLGGCSIDQVKDPSGLENRGFGSRDGEELDVF